MTMHHIISDGWSIDILRKDLAQLYSASLRGKDPLAAKSPLQIQYRDFAVWQKQGPQLAEHQRQLEYWVKQLDGSAPAAFLGDHPRPDVLSSKAGAVRFELAGDLHASLQDYSKSHQVTMFVILLSALRVAHYRLAGSETNDATIGTPIANRNRPELEDMIGFFVNTQCMRLRIEEGDTFDTLVKQARDTAMDAFANQDVPFQQLVTSLLPGSRDTSRNPLVQVMFALHAQERFGQIWLEGLEGEGVPTTPATRFDMGIPPRSRGGQVDGQHSLRQGPL